jgi:hypothetical protein
LQQQADRNYRLYLNNNKRRLTTKATRKGLFDKVKKSESYFCCQAERNTAGELTTDIPKKVYCFNLKGELVDVCESTKEAGKKYNINPTEISAICRNGKQKTAKGMTFSYTDKPVIDNFYETKILQYTTDGDLVREYDSIREASKETGAKEGSICSCISGKYKTSLGYVWKKKIIDLNNNMDGNKKIK